MRFIHPPPGDTVLRRAPRSLGSTLHMAHLSGNTSGVSKSSSDWLNYTGFPGDVCVAFFNILPGNQNVVAPNPLTKEGKPSCLQLTTSACQDQRNTEFSKVCENFKVRGIESLKYVREFYTPVIVPTFPRPKTWRGTNETWLVALAVSHMASWEGLGQSSQTFSRQLHETMVGLTRAAAGQMGALSRIVLLCPLP